MILVTGATGQLGTIVIQNLLKKTAADQVAAFVRDEHKASALKESGVALRVGDYDNLAALDKAMQGINKVLLIAATDEEKRVQQHQNVVNAAKKAGVACIAYTSRTLKDRSTMANKLMEGHFQTEDLIKESGLVYTIFRNVLYMDAIPQFVGERVFEAGIYLPAGQGKVAYALRSEMGEAIANTLLEENCSNKTYYFTGSAAYSFDDIAAVLTELSRKPVKYTPVEKSVFEDQMQARDVPALMVQRIAGFLTDIKNGQEADVSPDLEQQLGRKPASLKEGLKTLFNLPA